MTRTNWETDRGGTLPEMLARARCGRRYVYSRWSWLALSVLTAGCAGGGGVNSTPPLVGTPSPSTPTLPPAPPEPVPPFPGSSPSTFFLTDEVSATAEVRIERGNGTASVTGVERLTDVLAPNRNIISVEYRGPDSYFVETNGFGGSGFLPIEREDSSPPFDTYRSQDKGGYVDILQVAKKGVGITLTYMSFGSYGFLTTGDANNELTLSFLAIGSRTPSSQMPTTGTARFSGIVDGLWIDGASSRRLYGSSATLTADFAAGRVTSVLALTGRENPFGDFQSAPATSLGTFTGTGAISAAGFAGNYGSSNGYSGPFSGHFYGPGAEEYGLAFSLSGGANQSAFGIAAGKRD